MPSFLSKVFARKKEEKEHSRPTKRSSVASLLEGKFEAVSPNVSPSATHFPDSALHGNGKEKEKERGGGLSLLRARSRPVSPNVDASKPAASTPHLTLNLPVPKEEKSRALGVVFEADPEDRSLLSDNVVGERQLSPLEALLLVKACSSAIVNRGGLETLGVMHPYWYSASSDTQRKLISLFILSLAPKSPITTLSPTPTSPSTIFNTELEYARSPHDIASVLRWTLRHLRLEGDSFAGGSCTDQWQWYYSFADAERSSAYPDNAFSQILLPKLPPAHLQLLVATLEIVSSLAAHSERNGISGSKLSKVLGLWMLAARRTESEDDWATFYARWERAGRIFEHVFLAQIRDEMLRKKMPLRLSELVAGYPYRKDNQTEDGLLHRPRLSTRRYDAIYVRIEAKLPDFTTAKPKPHPLRLLADAMRLDANPQIGEHVGMWNTIRQAASACDTSTEETDENGQAYLTMSKVFADETIRLLSLIPAANAEYVPSPTDLASPLRTIVSRPARGRSTSLNSAQNGKLGQNGFGGSRAATSSDNLIPKDWQDFSSTGFGESVLGKDFAKTLLDNDLEVTQPPTVSHKASKRHKTSPTPSRQSSIRKPAALLPTLPLDCTRIDLIQLDEAFFDFWSDALLDPISSSFPSFVVCQLKPLPGVETNGKAITWLVLEQAFSRPPPPPEPLPASPVIPRRPSSPRPSIRSNMSSRKSATFSAARKRFTFFSSAQTIPSTLDSNTPAKKKASKSGRVGEMGEILPELPEGQIGNLHVDQPHREDPKDQSHEDGATVVATTNATSNSDMAHAAQSKTSDLPPVPVVDAEPRDDGVIAAVKRQEEPVLDKPLIPIPQDVTVPTDPPTVNENTGEVFESKPLPPAPEPVVLAGDTPGPQVALSTSEPAALAEASLGATLPAQSADVNALAPSTVAEVPESAPTSDIPLDEIDRAPASESIMVSAPASEATGIASTAEPETEYTAVAPIPEAEAAPKAGVSDAHEQDGAIVAGGHDDVESEEEPSTEVQSGQAEQSVVQDTASQTQSSPILAGSAVEEPILEADKTPVEVPATTAESHEEEIAGGDISATSLDEESEITEADHEESSVPQDEGSVGVISEPAAALGESKLKSAEAGHTVAQANEDEDEMNN